MPPRDPRLIRRADLARATGMAEWAIRRLDEAGGRMGDRWIYRGVIRPGQSASVDFLDDGHAAAVERRLIEATGAARTSAYAMDMLRAMGIE